jgi:hypothetical protein
MIEGQWLYLALVVSAFGIYTGMLAVQTWRSPGWPRRGRPSEEIVRKDKHQSKP